MGGYSYFQSTMIQNYLQTRDKLNLIAISGLLLLLIMRLSHSSVIPGVSVTPTTSLQSLVLNSLENWRSVSKKGDSSNGIPILDPFVIPFDITLRFQNSIIPTISPNYKVMTGFYELILSKLTFAGLSTFRVRALNIDPLGRDLKFENYIGNMSASTDYNLKYYLTSVFPIPISEGSAYGAIYGADLKGEGTILPSPDTSWFKLATISLTFSFESLDIRIYPKIPFIDPTLQRNVENTVYNAIQAMKPNMSQLSTMTYSKTVELKLS